MLQRIVLALIAITIPYSLSLCRQSTVNCGSSVKYENRNQTDPHPIVLSRLSGRVIAEGGNPSRSLGVIPKACISLFTEKEHAMIASVIGNEDGRFNFKNVRPGHYRIVVHDPQNVFCVANSRVTIIGSKQRLVRKQIVIHLRPAGIDDCSYADYK